MGTVQLHDLLVEVADGVPPIDASVVDGAVRQARHRRTVRWVAAPTAILVVAFAVVLAGLPNLRNNALQPAAPGANPTVPRHVADFPYLVATVDDAPAGRAVAVLGYYVRDEYRTVLLGADRDTYRVVEPELRNNAEYNSARLSPDGLTAALERGNGQVVLVDLRTGRTRRLQLPDRTGGAVVLGFSPDGKTMVAGTGAQLFDTKAVPYQVDVKTGRATRMYAAAVSAVAFSPDGRRMAVQGPGDLRILEFDRREVRRIATDSHRLAGPNSWSPDGRFLVTADDPNDPRETRTLRFVAVDPATPAREVPAERKIAGAAVLGWQSADRLVLRQTTQSYATKIALLGLQDGSLRVLAEGPASVDSIAAGLLPELGSRTAGEPDFGPWPDWLRWGLLIGALLLVALVLVLVKVARWAIRVNNRPFPT